jgi:Domain of unknown function (DUF5666)
MGSKIRMTSMLAPVAAAATLAAIPFGGAASAAPISAKSSSGLTSFHGTVTSVSTANRTFRIRRSSGRSLTFRVTSATVYERLSGGLSSLRGKRIEVKGKKVDGRWAARKIEPDDDDAGDDNGGGSGGGGSDDGPNHDAGDDHGSGGHGSDD